MLKFGEFLTNESSFWDWRDNTIDGLFHCRKGGVLVKTYTSLGSECMDSRLHYIQRLCKTPGFFIQGIAFMCLLYGYSLKMPYSP
jgi:hypothetical protein